MRDRIRSWRNASLQKPKYERYFFFNVRLLLGIAHLSPGSRRGECVIGYIATLMSLKSSTDIALLSTIFWGEDSASDTGNHVEPDFRQVAVSVLPRRWGHRVLLE